MQLLEKYFMVKLDNYNDEGFRPDTLKIFQELGLLAYGSKDLQTNMLMSEYIARQNVNKVNQETALKMLEKQLDERGRCQKCGGWFTSQYFEKRISRRQKQTEKARQALKEKGCNGGLSKSEKKIQACKANAARLNNSLTAEQRAEIQKKRIATMAKKREERERLKKLIEA